MKKMIFGAAAALLCGSVFAAIQSNNIVGYQTQGYDHSGYSIAAATFVPVTGDPADMTFGDVKPNDEFIYSRMSFITKTGATAKVDFAGKKVSANYIYWLESDEPANGEGWYLEADEDTEINQNSCKLPFGTGFMVFRSGDEPDATLTYAGQVKTTPVTKGFSTSGYAICGNCTPVAMTLGDITVNADFIYSRISFVTKTGATSKVDFGGKKVSANYIYWTADDEPANGPGWYLEADEDTTVNQNELVTLAPGQGFLIFRSGDEPNAQITVPSAL